MDDIVARLSELTLANFATTPPPAVSIETVEHAFNQLTMNDVGPPLPPTPLDISASASISDDDLKRLCLLDNRFDSHIKSIIHSLDSLSSPDLSSQHRVEGNLVEEKHWLRHSIQELHGLQNHPDADIQVLAEAMRNRMVQFASGIDMYLEVLQQRSSPQSSAHVVNTGDSFYPFVCLRF